MREYLLTDTKGKVHKFYVEGIANLYKDLWGGEIEVRESEEKHEKRFRKLFTLIRH